MYLQVIDYTVVAIYAAFLLFIAQWVSREKAGHEKTTSDYFLAGRDLPWWAIGASLIAANISAEQIIGMSGSAWVMGIAIGVYEWMAALTLIIAMIVAKPLLGNFDQAFQYIQEFTGFFTLGVCALFLMGIFWKRTTANAALGIAIGSAVYSLALKFLWPALPFIDRVGLAFMSCIATGVIISLVQGAEEHPDAIDFGDVDTRTQSGYNWAALGVVLMLVALYVTWW